MDESKMDDEQKTNDDKGGVASSPQELHDRLERYLRETENLLSWLKEGLEKGGDQLKALRLFDQEIREIGGGVEPIDTKAIEDLQENIRKHLRSLEELREKIKNDISKVESISAKINEILNQYGPQEPRA